MQPGTGSSVAVGFRQLVCYDSGRPALATLYCKRGKLLHSDCKYQAPNSKSQIPKLCFQGLLNHDSLLFPPWDLDLGIWDLEFFKMYDFIPL